MEKMFKELEMKDFFVVAKGEILRQKVSETHQRNLFTGKESEISPFELVWPVSLKPTLLVAGGG